MLKSIKRMANVEEKILVRRGECSFVILKAYI